MQEALQRHRACLETLRTQRENEGSAQETLDEAAGMAAAPAVAVELVDAADEDAAALGPIAYAKQLCDKATLALEQRGPVALIARDMHKIRAE